VVPLHKGCLWILVATSTVGKVVLGPRIGGLDQYTPTAVRHMRPTICVTLEFGSCAEEVKVTNVKCGECNILTGFLEDIGLGRSTIRINIFGVGLSNI
jgi:hypothetical protein